MSGYNYNPQNPNEWILNPTTRFAPIRETFFKSLVLVSGLSGMGKGVFGEEQNLNVISSGDLFRLTNSEDAKKGIMPDSIERIRRPFVQTFKKYVYGFLQGFDTGVTSAIPMVALDGIIRHGNQIIEVGSFINQTLQEVKTELIASGTDVDRRHMQYLDQILAPTDAEVKSETAKSIPKFNDYKQEGQSLEGAQNMALGFVSYANSVLIDGTKTDAERQILYRVVSKLLKKHELNSQLVEDMQKISELLKVNIPNFENIDSILQKYPPEQFGYRVDDAVHFKREQRTSYMYETLLNGTVKPGPMAQALAPFGYTINDEGRFALAGRENSFMLINGQQSGIKFPEYLRQCQESRDLGMQLHWAYTGDSPSTKVEGNLFNSTQRPTMPEGVPMIMGDSEFSVRPMARK